MNDQQLIREICKKEVDSGCYSAKIYGVSLYSLERDDFRRSLLEKAGLIVMENHKKVDRTEVAKSALQSIWQLTKLLISNRKYSTVFFPFARVDKINGLYIDKFTDPVIDISEKFGDDYILLDHGRAGVHAKPRLHQEKLVYIDFLHIWAEIKGRLFYKKFVKENQEAFDQLRRSLSKAFGEDVYNQQTERKIAVAFYYLRLLVGLYKHIKPQRVIQPMRISAPLVAAHLLGIKCYEFQHGVTYAESSLYSGYQDEMVVPDYFLAFGENKPIDVYGVQEERIVNIGWALWQYLEKATSIKKYGKDDVLVVSDPEITDYVISAVTKLGAAFPNSHFYVRPHPHEELSKQHLEIMNSLPNVHLQDKSINIMEVMMGFENIVGENSTVLYEALSMNKKVGKLFFEGLHPKYLEEADRESFWEIRTIEDMNAFINGTNANKKPKSIYSPFNKVLFEKTVFGQSA